jgi:hypothetical protein
MNCEEYRQAAGGDPARERGAAHLRDCPACRDYLAGIEALDARISRALAIDVPDLIVPDLPEPEADSIVPMRHRRPAAPAWLALAASVAIAAVLGARMLGIGVQYDSLADEVVAHLDHEPAALRVTEIAISDERLNSVVPASVANLDHGAGVISYAQTCIINGKRVPHLVIQGAKGPVTVLLMPEERVDEPIELAGENIKGIILPVGGGSVAFIGAADERLDSIRDEVLQSVTWTT